jgi:hypothetical protein
MKSFHLYQPPQALSITGGSGGGLTTFSRCPRRFFYSSGLRLQAGTGVGTALKFGEAIHAALPQAFFDDVPGAFASFLRVWGSTPEDDKRNPRTAKLILEDFASSHANGHSIYQLLPPPPGIPKLGERISDYEIPFALDVGLSRPLVGRVDALAQHRDTGELWAIEWKTSSEMSTRFFDGFTFNPQVLCYTLALRSYGLPVRGAIVEALKVSIAKAKAQETLSQPIFVDDCHIQDFLTWVRYVGTQIEDCEKHQEFPKDMSACTPYSQHGSAGYQCEFMPLCLVPDWTSLLPMFGTREPRPFELEKGAEQ